MRFSVFCCFNVLVYAVDANGVESKASHGTSCRLENMGDILKMIFRDGDTSHAKYYRVSSATVHQMICCLLVLIRRDV